MPLSTKSCFDLQMCDSTSKATKLEGLRGTENGLRSQENANEVSLNINISNNSLFLRTRDASESKIPKTAKPKAKKVSRKKQTTKCITPRICQLTTIPIHETFDNRSMSATHRPLNKSKSATLKVSKSKSRNNLSKSRSLGKTMPTISVTDLTNQRVKKVDQEKRSITLKTKKSRSKQTLKATIERSLS